MTSNTPNGSGTAAPTCGLQADPNAAATAGPPSDDAGVGTPTGDQCSRGRGSRERGQTTLDFATGMSVFLFILMAVLLFIPGTLEPFTGGSQENIVASNRVADQLSEGLLGDPASPHLLNTTCTVDFFDGTSPDYCRFSGSSLTERVGLLDRQHVNVSIEGNLSAPDGEDVLCWDDGSEQVIERDEGSCTTEFVAGPTSGGGVGSTVTAVRVVDVNGHDARLVVEVW